MLSFMRNIRLFATVAICLLCAASAAFAAFAIFEVGIQSTASFTPSWNALRMGAGGQITNIEYHVSDGTTLIRTDTYGAYLYKSSGTCTGWGTFASPCWQQLVTATSIPSPSITIPFSLTVGVVEITACSSNTSVLYMLFDGTLWVSTNKGANWTATSQTSSQDPNGGPKDEGPFLYCDPNNPDIIYVGTPSGVFKSTNGRSGGSATFSAVGAIATPTGGKGVIFAVDPNSSVTGSVTQHFMICSYGTGCYETTNGGTSYTLTTSTPTTLEHIICDKFSQFLLTDATTSLHVYVSSWSTKTLPDSGLAIATDPNSSAIGSNHIAVTRSGSGDLLTSANNGSSWSGPNFNATYAAIAPQPVWLGVANQQSAGAPSDNALGLIFDSSSNLWKAAGIGVWTTPAPVSASGTPWASSNIGIEQLVDIQVVSPPGGSPLTSVWDKGFFLVKNPDVYPTVQWTNATSNSYGAVNPIVGGWNLDYAAPTTGFVTGWAISNIGSGTAPASSTDGGTTWTLWPTVPATNGAGGNIAASTTTNWIVVPGCSGCNGGGAVPLYFTTNAGTTWTLSTVSGSPTWLGTVGVRQALAADRVAANTFCIVDENQNFYNSTNSGSSFTLVATSSAVDGAASADFLVSVPGQSGTFFYTSGSQGGAHPANRHLWKSTNTCASWTDVNVNLKEVFGVGFGAASPSAGSYTIYAIGWLSGTLGMYQSIDGGTTWTAISAPASQQVWPENSLDFVTWVSGDPNVYGRIYVGFRGSGAAYLDTQDACPWVNFSNTNANAALTGTVTLQAQHSGLVPVTSVSFYVDGSLIGTQTTGSGTPTTYSQSWVTGGVAHGAHTLTVSAIGNGCNTPNQTYNSFTIPITTSQLIANDNTPMWLERVG